MKAKRAAAVTTRCRQQRPHYTAHCSQVICQGQAGQSCIYHFFLLHFFFFNCPLHCGALQRHGYAQRSCNEVHKSRELVWVVWVMKRTPVEAKTKHLVLENRFLRVVFGIFLLTGKSDWALVFSLVLYFSPDRFWYPYIKFTTTLIFDPYIVIFQIFKWKPPHQNQLFLGQTFFPWLSYV